jgi:NADP-dependent 3-hydroxy acid dehydrogenase YdfG
MSTLQGRRALVTGSVQGIGLAIAKALVRQGATVVLHGLPDPQVHAAARAALAECSSAPVLTLGHDLADPAQVQRLMQEVLDAGPLDILVNNAGIQHTAPLHEMPRARWDAILAINLSAAFDTMRLALPGMVARGYGRIVNVASVHGLVASVNKAPYVAAKFCLVGLTRVAALEAARGHSRQRRRHRKLHLSRLDRDGDHRTADPGAGHAVRRRPRRGHRRPAAREAGERPHVDTRRDRADGGVAVRPGGAQPDRCGDPDRWRMDRPVSAVSAGSLVDRDSRKPASRRSSVLSRGPLA